ncbi:MAG: phenylalanine--tRNA ligase subunit beta [Candidatus Omnitrophica bacterium]|nr:phenylalanine--tRNA ligase subunit beta [Candidatus Omnitrophota bacterium]
MKVTYSWLKDFVDIKLAPEKLADKLTMAGLEVVSLEQKQGDFVFEIEITSNRPDWLSVSGIAREVAAITNSKIRIQKSKSQTKIKNSKQEKFEIEIENKKDCSLYTAKIIRGVKVGPSPEWLKTRLELVGCRSVNNIVDITNHVLFETGEPLHAFDLDKLSGASIIVRRARSGEKITTIDGEIKQLSPDILVIADARRPVACAGIMGGKDTEVTEGTKNILLEAAVFNPILIRKARQVLGLQSESAYRFERSVDASIVESSSQLSADLIEKLSPGKTVLAKSAGSGKVIAKNIILDCDRVARVLGVKIPAQKIKTILQALGFTVKAKSKSKFSVLTPSHRQDAALDVDLIEEIARIYGYELIPRTIPSIKPQAFSWGVLDAAALIKNILTGLGLNEAITYSLTERNLAKSLGQTENLKAVEIRNPLSREQEILRTSLMPSLVKCAGLNLNQKQEYVNLFEIARRFYATDKGPKEELCLGVLLCGRKSLSLEQGMVKDEAGLLHLKGIIENMLLRLGIKEFSFSPDGQIVRIEVAGKKAGSMFRLSRSALDLFDIKNREVFVAELSLDNVIPALNLKKKFTAPPKYPGITRDISLLLREELGIDDVFQALRSAGEPLLKELKVTDFYKGKQVPAGWRGLTISCIYRSDERTLTEAEVAPVHAQLNALLTGRFGATIR